MIFNEITTMRRIEHPNIMKLERVYDEETQVCLVMEYIEGGDLFARMIDCDRISERYAAIVARKLLTALAYMHEKNIIHRDLKLENIMLTSIEEESDIKLADFGFAAETTPENMSLYCGSPGYSAPEILLKQTYNSKVDIFSLGVVIHILLSGKAPFFGRTVEETLMKNREGQIKLAGKCWTHISEEAKDFVRLITTLNPIDRPSAVEALHHKWIYSNSRHYFDSLESSLKRPTHSRRRPRIDLSSSKQTSKEILLLPSANPLFPSLKPHITAVTPNPSSHCVSFSRRVHFLNSESPNTNSPIVSPMSAGLGAGLRKTTWEQIKPHK